MVLAEQLTAAPVRLDLRAVVALAKPRLSSMVLCTTGVGLYLAPGHMSWLRAVTVLLATAWVVGSANALNCYLERHTDARMRRTRSRPLPAQRLDPHWVLALSLVGGAVAIAALYWAANPLTALLSFVAFAIYGWVYTPMKRHSWLAVLVGAIPGAIPPLLGWTAATGRLGEPGLALFSLLFFWQLPHFLAIAIYLREDYARGGLQVLPVVHGARWAVRATVATAVALVPASLWPWHAGLGGVAYAIGALVCGAMFVAGCAVGLFRRAPGRWARQVFLASIAYLIVLLGLLITGAPTR